MLDGKAIFRMQNKRFSSQASISKHIFSYFLVLYKTISTALFFVKFLTFIQFKLIKSTENQMKNKRKKLNEIKSIGKIKFNE